MQDDTIHAQDYEDGSEVPNPDQGPVTAVIRRTVRPGKEADFEAWLKGIGNDAIQFPGHLGTNIIRPTSRKRPEYIIIFRFDTYRHLENWESSDVRRKWVERVQPLIIGETHIHRLSGLEYWFTLPDYGESEVPPRLKMAFVTWLALFPVVLLVQPVLSRLLGMLPWWVQIMIMAAVMVALMTWLVMPFMTRLFKSWLYKGIRSRSG